MTIEHLTFSYGDFKVFDNFHFKSDEALIAFKGPSGSGKSTLLKIISKQLEPARGSKISYSTNPLLIVQEDALLPWKTGYQNIAKFTALGDDFARLIDRFGSIDQYLHKTASEMSYGQRRTIELLRAMLIKPSLLLLDEPFNFLDISNRSLFISQLLYLVELGTKIILTTHNEEDIKELAPTIFYFNEFFPKSTLTQP